MGFDAAPHHAPRASQTECIGGCALTGSSCPFVRTPPVAMATWPRLCHLPPKPPWLSSFSVFLSFKVWTARLQMPHVFSRVGTHMPKPPWLLLAFARLSSLQTSYFRAPSSTNPKTQRHECSVDTFECCRGGCHRHRAAPCWTCSRPGTFPCALVARGVFAVRGQDGALQRRGGRGHVHRRCLGPNPPRGPLLRGRCIEHRVGAQVCGCGDHGGGQQQRLADV